VNAISRIGHYSDVALEPTSAPYLNRLQCEECNRVNGEGERGGTARLICGDEVVVYCPECDAREFRMG
jgi:RNase P subunit RPR2